MKVFPILLLSLCSTPLAFADGVGAGGGGDAATEMRINDLRADILKWVSAGGAKALELPSRVAYGTYLAEMTRILQPHAVVIGAVTTAQEAATQDDELRVSVGGEPKTCRGFRSSRDGRPHILCNSERFAKTEEAAQYRLVHHEYAGLAGVELNRGASSDYEVSSQLTGFLVPETVLRLAVKEAPKPVAPPIEDWAKWTMRDDEELLVCPNAPAEILTPLVRNGAIHAKLPFKKLRYDYGQDALSFYSDSSMTCSLVLPGKILGSAYFVLEGKKYNQGDCRAFKCPLYLFWAEMNAAKTVLEFGPDRKFGSIVFGRERGVDRIVCQANPGKVFDMRLNLQRFVRAISPAVALDIHFSKDACPRQ